MSPATGGTYLAPFERGGPTPSVWSIHVAPPSRVYIEGAIFPLRRRYPGRMTKRLIDVDDAKLDAVRTLLGTTTLKATVDGAFDEVLALVKRRRVLLAEHGVDPAALADPQARTSAWG